MAIVNAIQSKRSPHEPAPDQQREEQPLEAVLADIREDARRRAPDYGQDTVVPEGGE